MAAQLKLSGCTDAENTGNWQPLDNGQPPESAVFSVIKRMRTVLYQHTPLFHSAHTQLLRKTKQNKNLTDCIAFKQQNNMDKCQETGLTQHTFRVSKGYHSIALVIHCENRLARQLKFFFHFFPQSLKTFPSIPRLIFLVF